jgi:hypothetical protein
METASPRISIRFYCEATIVVVVVNRPASLFGFMRIPHKPNKGQALSESAGLLIPLPPQFKAVRVYNRRRYVFVLTIPESCVYRSRLQASASRTNA